MNRRDFMLNSSLVAAGALVSRSTILRAATSGGPVVETASGKVRGYMDRSVYSFRGVPYGDTTAGASRFLPPRKPQAWAGVRDAIELGHRAPQLDAPRVPEWFVMDRTEPQGEDCLVVNVWTPGLDNQKRPVVVWLHGGGFTGGSNGFTAYDGANLARRHNVVVVGVNHRLNGFGFLYLGELCGDKFADANAGMLDIVASLQWVKENIDRFGGDPASVTIFGQSGGASKVSTLLGMPAAHGLFHRAYAMSGSQVRSTPRDQATANARNLLQQLNISPAQIEKINDVPMRRLRDLVNGGGVGGWGPVVDGRTLPDHIFDPKATEISSDVPLMIGSTETEQTWNANQLYDPLTDAELREDAARAMRTTEAAAQGVIDLYKRNRTKASNLDIYLILATDASNFRTGTDTEALRKAEQHKAPVYKYYFQWYSPVRGGMLRSMHTMDVPFVFFNHTIAESELGPSSGTAALAEKMSSTFVQFAKTGNPNNKTIPNWPAYDPAVRQTMVWNNEPKLVNDPFGAEKAAIAAVPREAAPAGGGTGRGRGRG
jgi:para-nitrobenzyl esterase